MGFRSKAYKKRISNANDCLQQLFFIRSLTTQEGKNMNEIMETTVATYPLDLYEEVLAADGTPTGEYRLRETPQEGATVYTTAEDGDHEVVLN